MPNYCSNVLSISHPDATLIQKVKENKDKLFEFFIPVPNEVKHSNPNILSEEEYSFRCKNWGTKWDVIETFIVEEESDANTLKMTFDTAWTPPIPLMSFIEEQGYKVHLLAVDECLEWLVEYKDHSYEEYSMDGIDSGNVGEVYPIFDKEFSLTEMLKEREEENEE